MDFTKMSISQRLRLFLNILAIGQSEFAKSINVSQQVVSNALSGRTKYPKSDFLIKIIEVYPNVNLYWLLQGKGEMYLSKEEMVDENLKVINQKLLQENSELKSKLISLLEQPIEV